MKTLIIATLLLSSSVCQAGEPDKDLHNKCIYPTVMLIGTNPHYAGIGTGVIVKSTKRGKGYINYVFTCAHVLTKTPAQIIESDEDVKEGEDPIPPKVVPAKYEYVVKVAVYENWSLIKKIKTYPCYVIHAETENSKDMALVTFQTDKKMPVVEIYLNPKLYIGNEVCHVGCGLGEPFRVDFGKITSLSNSVGRPIVDTKNLYRTSIMTIMGDSGGPVYHENKLIGLTQMIRGMPAGQSGPFRINIPVFNMSYVIPIKRFMDCKKITKHLKEPVVQPVAPPPPEEEVAPPPPED